MRRHALQLATLLAVLLIVGADVARARPNETFTLQDSDKLIVEAPGCHAFCGIQTPQRRECAVREPDCTVVCQPIPECKPDGLRPMRVCAVVRERR
ncbi:MAG TPA: hypothetical protein VFE30_11925 [Anaeromyxobacteraceae bacterium]|jgi:hypothetical protein|nr:hypothetical protein [Anaeromyxobacteraceae bacterium]